MTATEKINTLKTGSIITSNGKTYEVKHIRKVSEKINRHVLTVLEVGKPEEYQVEGKFLAAGQIITLSNLHTIEVSNYQNQNTWQFA